MAGYDTMLKPRDKKDAPYAGFEQGPIRPPSEAHSLLIRVTRNCPWNRCTFCPVYKGARFSLRPVEHVKKDIDSVHKYVQILGKIDVAHKHLQPLGHVHGGVFASIIDAATFWAVFYGVEESAGATSVDLKLNYLAPARSGKLIARGRQLKLGRTLGYADAEVTDESGRLLAHGTSTLMVLHGKGIVNASLPPKFLG
jgi:uncharacterized protein (TIGR00369 family)